MNASSPWRASHVLELVPTWTWRNLARSYEDERIVWPSGGGWGGTRARRISAACVDVHLRERRRAPSSHRSCVWQHPALSLHPHPPPCSRAKVQRSQQRVGLLMSMQHFVFCFYAVLKRWFYHHLIAKLSFHPPSFIYTRLMTPNPQRHISLSHFHTGANGAALQMIRHERALISPQPNTRHEAVHQCFQYKQIS